MKKIINLLIIALTILTLVGCNKKNTNKIIVKAEIVNKEENFYTRPMVINKMVYMQTWVEHYFYFNDKEEYKLKVESKEYNKFEIGNVYEIKFNDTTKNRNKVAKYFNEENISYVILN